MPDLLDEIHEDLRAERAQALLRRFGGAALAGAVLLVAAVGAWQAWEWHRGRQSELAAARYFEAVRAAGPDGTGTGRAAALFEAVANDPAAGSWRLLARLQEAALSAPGGAAGHAGALALWNRVATDPATDPALRNAATLAWAEHGIDAGDPAAIAARLRPLTAPGNVWRGLATEDLALLDLRAGHMDAARARLRALVADPAAPGPLRARANLLLESGA